MEFGVWEGATLNGVAEYRRINCDDRPASNFVYGFDTFTGLPEAWGEFRPSVSTTCHLLSVIRRDLKHALTWEGLQPHMIHHSTAWLFVANKGT